MPSIQIRKSEIPIIWLDTFVIIRFAKLLNGERLDKVEEERYRALHEILLENLTKRKIICIKSEQIEEVKFGKRLVTECDDVLAALSFGISIKNSYGVEQEQLYTFMEAYKNEEKEILLDYKDAFYRDPKSEIESIDSYFITIKETMNEETTDKAIKRKADTIQELELLRIDRVEKKISFEQQLQIEYRGVLQAMDVVLEEVRSGKCDFNKYMAIIGDNLCMWDEISGNAHDMKGLVEFFMSEYYRVMPVNDIKAKLFARIITETTPIETGDAMDISNISTLAPYCNMMLTDRRMKNRTRALGIDKLYNVKVYSIQDIDEIIGYLRDI